MQSDKSLLQSYYQTHHKEGKRYNKSVMEEKRGAIFKDWIQTGKVLVDLGGRDGKLTRYFIEGNDVTIGDIDEVALNNARQTLNVKTQLTNLNEALPFTDAQFDVVTMSEVLEHLPYPNITLQEIIRILKPGGNFICNFPLAYHLQDRVRVATGQRLTISRDPTHLQFFSYGDALALLSKYFRVEDIHILKGGKPAKLMPKLFARNVAFKCVKTTD